MDIREDRELLAAATEPQRSQDPDRRRCRAYYRLRDLPDQLGYAAFRRHIRQHKLTRGIVQNCQLFEIETNGPLTACPFTPSNAAWRNPGIAISHLGPSSSGMGRA